MPKKITFNDIVQNKIKDFVGTKRWSNSWFANRYIDTFTEIYGKMEAPSTSTSRKLVEEKGHEYSEKECIVLERLTAITFHKMWLEEQKRVILKKMDDYSLAHGEESSNHEKTFDTEVQLGDLVRKYTKFADSLSVDDLTVSISRYINIETKMPLVVLCDTASFASYLVEECADNALCVEADKLLEDGADYPNNVIYTSLKVSPMSKEAGKCVNDALKVIYGSAAIGKTKHVIVIIESWDSEAIAKSLTEWNETALLLQFHWTYQIMHGWLRMEENAGRMHPVLKKYIGEKITEIKNYKDPNGNSHYKPSFEYLYSIHNITCMNLDKGEEQLLKELMKDDVHTFGINNYLISKVFKTDDFEEMMLIHRDLEKKVASLRPTVPETTQKHIIKCLNKVKTWPQAFRDEILSWMSQGGSPVMPDCDGADEWMEFLMNQYEKQEDWLEDENYLSALTALQAVGFPMHWFSDCCDQKSLLTAMITYPEWKKVFPHNEDFDLPQLQLILLSGETPSLDVKGWKRWFERTYNLNLVAFNFDLMIQIHQLKLKLGRVL
ncbi:hypothetical protein ST44_09635 [Prevotella pectinovora]|uniref:Uncharacterized protein n=1 Tax=Prevotella pectinovora TaxID=1602169 RepID=A0A0D0HBH9_9BACT|nr:hypothetical protein [Prevotella pectinovora]KIP61324.1 hypothetical protein ST44_09635 [Prevotella pectinovora]